MKNIYFVTATITSLNGDRVDYGTISVLAEDKESAEKKALFAFHKSQNHPSCIVEIKECHWIPNRLVNESFISLFDDISGKPKDSYSIHLLAKKHGDDWTISSSEINSVDDLGSRIEYLECALRDAHNEVNKLREAITSRDKQIEELVTQYESNQAVITDLESQVKILKKLYSIE